MLEVEVNVKIGEVKCGSAPQKLKAILGSCVGVGFLVPSIGAYALAHCLLARSEQKTDEITAKTVEQAIPSLLKILNLTKWDAPLIRAVVVGGASMHGEAKQKILKIGEANSLYALKLLEAHKIQIVHQDLGDNYGRQLVLDCSDGSYFVRKLSPST